MEPHGSVLAGMLALMLGAETPAGPATPADSPLTMRDVMSSALYADLSTPKLDSRRGVARPTGKTVSLASFQGKKPVALIFGSYT